MYPICICNPAWYFSLGLYKSKWLHSQLHSEWKWRWKNEKKWKTRQRFAYLGNKLSKSQLFFTPLCKVEIFKPCESRMRMVAWRKKPFGYFGTPYFLPIFLGRSRGFCPIEVAKDIYPIGFHYMMACWPDLKNRTKTHLETTLTIIFGVTRSDCLCSILIVNCCSL